MADEGRGGGASARSRAARNGAAISPSTRACPEGRQRLSPGPLRDPRGAPLDPLRPERRASRSISPPKRSIARSAPTSRRCVMPGGLEAVRTAVWFWSDRPAKDFEHWTDPRTWARTAGSSSSRWSRRSAGSQGRPRSSRAAFRETVERRRRRTTCRPTSCSRRSIVEEPRLYALGVQSAASRRCRRRRRSSSTRVR